MKNPLSKANCQFALIFSLFITLIFFGFLPSVSAQDLVRGKVMDEASGEALVGARIIIEGTRVGGMSREDGTFSFRPGTAPPFTILATFLGYDTLRLEVSSLRETLELGMTENFVTLGEVN
ncbi:MAG: carboxypeptidase-like regulatory domain-containing protein, partial [Bacteroidota bacterium]